jgi:hypothetical protein
MCRKVALCMSTYGDRKGSGLRETIVCLCLEDHILTVTDTSCSSSLLAHEEETQFYREVTKGTWDVCSCSHSLTRGDKLKLG